MIKMSITLQDLRRKIYIKAKAEKQLKSFGWERWSRRDLYEKMGLYNDYQIQYYRSLKAITADRR
jgi:RNA-directed DNA polymerase